MQASGVDTTCEVRIIGMACGERGNYVREEILCKATAHEMEAGEFEGETYTELVGRHFSGRETLLNVVQYATE